MAKDCECCKQWRKHLFWTDNDPPTVHFFVKMLMDDGFQEKLAIPRKFVNKFGSKLPQTVVLEGPHGKATNIGLTRTEDDVYFGHGWSQFASNHSLEKFDLLVFRFNERDTCFQVMLFDKTACEKEGVHVACVRESDRPGLDTNGTQSVQINKDCTSDALSSESSPHSSECSLHSIDSYYVPSSESSEDGSDSSSVKGQKRAHSSECSLHSIDSYYVPSSESSEDGSDSSSVKGQKRENIFRARHGYPSTSCVKKNPRQNSLMKKNRNGALNPINLGTSRKLKYYRYFRSKRRAVTIEEQQLALDKTKERADSSTKPHFIRVMKQSHVHRRFFMTIPIKFLRQNFSEVPEIGLLRVTGKTKTWNVTITAKGHSIQPGIGISGGWADFVMKNNLEKGDACLFELDNINPICKSVMKLDVTIFRVVDKIVPLKRTPGKSPL